MTGIIASALAILISTPPVQPVQPVQPVEEPNGIVVTLGVRYDVKSGHFGRGIDVSEGSTVFQEKITAKVDTRYGNYKAQVFGNFDKRMDKITEIDLCFEGTWDLSKSVSATAGMGRYWFPNKDKPTREVYGIINLNKELKTGNRLVQGVDMGVSIMGALDFGQGSGIIGELKFKQDIDFGKFGINEFLLLTYNKDYYTEGQGFSHGIVGVEFPVQLVKLVPWPAVLPKITIVPNFCYQMPMQDNFSKKFPSAFVAGLGIKLVE